jgi:acyl-CoA reductase-like NAD-dependent aldehyde dehydrogenase
METATSHEPAERDHDTSARATSPASSAPPAITGSSPFATRSPLDDSALSVVEATPLADLQGLVDRARVAQLAWADVSVRDRALAIGKIKQRILARAEEIAELVHRECGKPIEEAALAEVLPNADLVDYWTAAIEELLDGTTIELDAISYPGKMGRIHKDARGTLALITPWNYPVAIPLRTLVPALLAGNAVLFKPSEITPRAGALVASLFAGILPEGVLTLVQGGGDIGSALVAAEGIDLVVFTGSVATGRRIAVACAERLIPCSLELGGKDAAIALADCEIERTSNGIVWGAFTNAGQNCAAVERVYIDKNVADRLIPKIVAAAKALRPGVDTAMITTQKQCAIVRRHLADAVAAGGEILVGGAPEEGSLAFPPTVIKLATEDTALMREETFGPILPIFVVDGEDDAITRTNASKFGLTTSLWTRRYNHAHTLAKRLRSGVVTINNHGFTAAIPAAPWTGAGDSGYGITNSAHALAELTRVRFVLEDRNGAKRELWWYPYTPVLRTIAFAMAKLRGGAGIGGRLRALFKLIGALPKRLSGG